MIGSAINTLSWYPSTTPLGGGVRITSVAAFWISSWVWTDCTVLIISTSEVVVKEDTILNDGSNL